MRSLLLDLSFRRSRAATFVGGFLTACALAIAPAEAQKFDTIAPYALLMDTRTGTVLFEKAADDLMVPASMVKVMTAAVVFDELRKGRIKPDDEFMVSENAWRKGGSPSGSSTMFAVLGSRIKVSDLLAGAIVQSGNDACITLAEGVAGTEENFANMMTAYGRQIGLTKSVFKNATGLGDPEQRTTARELALLADHIIKTYPDQYPLFAEKDFTWNKIRQVNRNPLLTMDIGADGLKTGNIAEAGFGLIGSAVRDGRRLIVVVNGLKSARDRATESRKLLEWGFNAFETRTIFPEGAVIGRADVYGGEQSGVDLVANRPVALLMPRGSQEKLDARIIYHGPLQPPVAKGAKVAQLRVMRGNVQALDLPLYAAEDVATGPVSRRAFDAVTEWGLGLVRQTVGGTLLGKKS